MAPLFEHYGIQLWTPELGGGSTFTPRTTSRRCWRWGCRRNVKSSAPGSGSVPRWPPRPASRAAIWVAARPTGTELADAGPHPNKAHAAWGRRAHRLEPDPDTAPVVPWMFGQRLAGHSVARITRALTMLGSRAPRLLTQAQPAPFWCGVDFGHGRGDPGQPALHRPAGAESAAYRFSTWSIRGTPGWAINRYRDGTCPTGWVISARPAHPALVSEADYIAAQDATAPRGPAGPATRRYLLAGLLVCGRCGRRLESAWSNGKPAYRCRHGYTSATRPNPGGRRTSISARSQILPRLAALAILHASHDRIRASRKTGSAQVTAPAQTAKLIDRLRLTGTSLIYDPAARTLRTDTTNSLLSPSASATTKAIRKYAHTR